jgi:hypothetical protein
LRDGSEWPKEENTRTLGEIEAMIHTCFSVKEVFLVGETVICLLAAAFERFGDGSITTSPLSFLAGESAKTNL